MVEINFRRCLSNALNILLPLTSLVGAAYIGYVAGIKRTNYERDLREIVRIIADKDNNGITSREEMEEVCRSLWLGQTYERELSISEMEKYLEASKGK